VKGTKEISIKAVIIGLLVDIGGTFAFSFVFRLLAAIVLTSAGRNSEDLEVFTQSIVFLLCSLAAGLLFTSLGGYVTARFAAKAEMKNALAMGILSALSGVIFLVLSHDSSPLWFNVLSLLLVIPAAMLGGYVRLSTTHEQKKRK
jgi:hypothetical protein